MSNALLEYLTKRMGVEHPFLTKKASWATYNHFTSGRLQCRKPCKQNCRQAQPAVSWSKLAGFKQGDFLQKCSRP